MAFFNTKANEWLFIDTALADLLKKRFDCTVQQLANLVFVTGFNNKKRAVIFQALVTTLEIDGKRFTNSIFLITDLRHYKIIVSRKWIAEIDITFAVRKRKLV